MQVNREEEREAIARIVDPYAWDERGPGWIPNGRRNEALAKADAILALRTKEPSRG